MNSPPGCCCIRTNGSRQERAFRDTLTGMTGIDRWSSGVSRPVLDERARRDWLSAVHDALRATTPPGRVQGEVREPGPGWNYYAIVVQIDDQSLRLVLNAAARLVACAYDEGSGALRPLRFREVPNPEAFVAAGFSVTSVEDLTAQIRHEHIVALSPDEQADVSYHRPETVGDLLFNWFD